MKNIIFTFLLALIFTSQVQAACLTTTHPYSSGVLAANMDTVVYGPFSVQASRGCRGIIEVGIDSTGLGAKPSVRLEQRSGSTWKPVTAVRGSTTVFVENGEYRVVYANNSAGLASYGGYTKLSR